MTNLLVASISLLISAATASATQLYDDGFDCPTGSALEADSSWQHAIDRPSPPSVQCGSLSYPGLPNFGKCVRPNNAIGDTDVLSRGPRTNERFVQ